MSARGYFGVGVYHPKREVNVGTLWRTAHVMGAAFVFTVGRRYKHRQAGDTTKADLSIPLHHYDGLDDLLAHLPNGAPLVGVELDPRAVPLSRFTHPERAVYLLGAEDHGLPVDVLDACHHIVQCESLQPWSSASPWPARSCSTTGTPHAWRWPGEHCGG